MIRRMMIAALAALPAVAWAQTGTPPTSPTPAAPAAAPIATPAPSATPPPTVPAPIAKPAVVPAEQLASTDIAGLLGHPIVDSTGEEVGRVTDLLVDAQGRLRAAVIDVGGFMGVGNRKVAVAWSALRFADGPKGPVVSITITPDRIKSWGDYIAGRPVAILGSPGGG